MRHRHLMRKMYEAINIENMSRWWFGPFLAITGLGWTIGPGRWHQGAIYSTLNSHYNWWTVYGVAFLLSGVMLILERTRVLGYAIGLFTLMWLTFWIWVEVVPRLHTATITGIFAPAAFAILAGVWLLGMTNTIIRDELRRH